MKTSHLRTALFVILCFLLHDFRIQAQDKTILTLAEEYSTALGKYQNQKNRISVESVVKKGQLVADKLDEMENLNASDYQRLKRKMKGFAVNRDEILYVVPDAEFFGNLSRKSGTAPDIVFFELLKQIRPDNVWAVYIEQQTDYSGCTIYGNGLLTKFYGKTLQFKRQHKKAYESDINIEIDSILNEFSDNPCACGDRNGILKEYRLFIKTFPKDKNTTEIRKRLAKLKKSATVRSNCISG